MIAALFVQTNGVYYAPELAGLVDPWDEKRDARKYAGPHPVVAHPPCQLWTNMARVNVKRWGGEHNRPGNDGGCFAAALAAVRQWGGVLEHPAESWAWAHFGLLAPPGRGWARSLERPSEFTCEVWQSAYGHKAQKRTWLLYVGSSPPVLRWAHTPGTHQIGRFDRVKPTLGKRESSATPVAFRDALLDIARSADRKRGAA